MHENPELLFVLELPNENPDVAGFVVDVLPNENPDVAGFVVDVLPNEKPEVVPVVLVLVFPKLNPDVAGFVVDVLPNEKPVLAGLVVALVDPKDVFPNENPVMLSEKLNFSQKRYPKQIFKVELRTERNLFLASATDLVFLGTSNLELPVFELFPLLPSLFVNTLAQAHPHLSVLVFVFFQRVHVVITKLRKNDQNFFKLSVRFTEIFE